MVDDITVAVAVLNIWAAHADEGLHIVGAKLDGVGAHPGDVAQQAIVHRDFARAALAEGEIALHIDKLGQHQGGIFDAGLNEGAAGKVQVNRLGPCGHGQALGTKALDEVDGRLGLLRALPAVAPVHAHFNILTKELEDVAATGHHKLAGRGLEREKLGNDLGEHAGRLHDGQGHIDICNGQAEDTLLVPDGRLGIPVRNAVAHEHVSILDTHQRCLDLYIGDGAPVAGQINVGKHASGLHQHCGGGKADVTEAGSGVDGDLAPRALLIGEGALHKHEFADLQCRQADVHPEKGTVKVQSDRLAAGEHRQATRAVGGLEVHVGRGRRIVIFIVIGPGIALVGGDADLVAADGQEVDADQTHHVHIGRQRPHVWHHLFRIAVEHQRQVQVVDGKADGVAGWRVVHRDATVFVAVNKVLA